MKPLTISAPYSTTGQPVPGTGGETQISFQFINDEWRFYTGADLYRWLLSPQAMWALEGLIPSINRYNTTHF